MKFEIESGDITKIQIELLSHKLFVAQLALKDIPEKIPSDQASTEYFSMETNIEIFLLFLTSAHDAIFNEINQKFGTGLDKPSYYNLEPKLKSLDDENARKISVLISKYFKRPKLQINKITKEQFDEKTATKRIDYGLYPSKIFFDRSPESINELTKWSSQVQVETLEYGYYERYWNFEHSSQWIASQLRNEIAHGLQMIPFSYHENNKVEKTNFVIEFTYKFKNQHDSFWFEEGMPFQFFNNQFEDMIKFVAEVKKFLPETDELIAVKRPSIEFIRASKEDDYNF